MNNAVIAAVPEFHNFYGKPGHVLVTSDAALDLSHTLIDSFVIKSTNALGTAFTVKTADTAGSATLNWIILFHTEHIRHFILPTLAMQEAIQLHLRLVGGYLTVSGDVNGDGQADFAFIVKAAVLHHTDFLL